MSNDDLIRRGDVKTRICIAECAAPECGCVCNLMEAVDGTPAVDAVEVVRCKYCKWGEEKCGNIECDVDRNVPPEYHGYDWFCPNGERREERG